MAFKGFAQVLGAVSLGAMLAGCQMAPAPRSASAPAAAGEPQSATSPEALLARLSIESKVAQIIQPDIGSITPEDVRRYRFCTILNGGNSGPYGNDKAPAADWLRLADEYWEASTAPLANGEPVIPALWATDAVHGHAHTSQHERFDLAGSRGERRQFITRLLPLINLNAAVVDVHDPVFWNATILATAARATRRRRKRITTI